MEIIPKAINHNHASEHHVNPFQVNVPFLYLLKTSENLRRFPGVQKGNIGQKSVKDLFFSIRSTIQFQNMANHVVNCFGKYHKRMLWHQCWPINLHVCMLEVYFQWKTIFFSAVFRGALRTLCQTLRWNFIRK